MSSLILCRTKEAVRPYHIRDMGVRIYTLEELCYLVYNNIYVISKDFFSDSLINLGMQRQWRPKYNKYYDKESSQHTAIQ